MATVEENVKDLANWISGHYERCQVTELLRLFDVKDKDIDAARRVLKDHGNHKVLKPLLKRFSEDERCQLSAVREALIEIARRRDLPPTDPVDAVEDEEVLASAIT